MPTLRGNPVSVSVSQAAARWLVALDAPDVTMHTRERWQAWLAADPEHARAWSHLQEMGVCLRQLNPAVAHSALVEPDVSAQRGRRKALRLLVGGVVSGAGFWALHDRVDWRAWQADLRTAVGQRHRMTLADGSELTLNTDSAANVRFDDDRRLVQMVRGEVLVSTGRDPKSPRPRPFLVDTAQGALRALGTRFIVRQHRSACVLSVLDGAVEVRPADAPSQSFVVQAGLQARFDGRGMLDSAPADPAAGAWSNGMLIVHQMPMREFIADLARYRQGYLVCDASVADVPVSGIFPVDDTDRVLDMLVKTLPVSVHSRTRYWVTVQAKA